MKAAALAAAVTMASLSCAQSGALPFQDKDGKASSLQAVSGTGREARTGKVRSGQGFSFPKMDATSEETGLIVDYAATGLDWGKVEVMTRRAGGGSAETLSWELALANKPLSFCLPIPAGRILEHVRFSFGPESGAFAVEGLRADQGGAFRGYAQSEGRITLSPGCSMRPVQGGRKSLSLPLAGLPPGAYSLSVEYSSNDDAKTRLLGAGRNISLLPSAGGKPLVIPLELADDGNLSLDMPPPFSLSSFALTDSGDGPITTDPRFILDWEKSRFRKDGCEVFRWDAFPSILILLYSDYGEQDQALKRLAFYAEKAGFRGRLASDAEIAGLHGWNAHDYPASTLAAFYSKAASEGFPLLARELELRGELEANGIITKKDGLWAEGKGALISVSLESSATMRRRFLAHEGFHGIYFVDGEFRKGVKDIWDSVDPDLKDYVLEFFDFKEFDVTDPGLMATEFASYFLQTPYEETPGYFCITVADFLEADRRGGGRYRRFAKEREGAFLDVAKKLDALAFSLYGLGSGRVWRTESP